MSFHCKGGYDFNDLQLRPRWDGDQQTKPMNIFLGLRFHDGDPGIRISGDD